MDPKIHHKTDKVGRPDTTKVQPPLPSQQLQQLSIQQQQQQQALQKANGAKIDISKQLHKTKMCMHYLKGKCRYGGDCSYAHNEIELRHRPNLRKTRLCKNFEMGACDNPHCAYAHGSEELRGTDGVWKTVMCAKWLNGTCRAGTRCRFAHGQHELQDPPEAEEEEELREEYERARVATVDYQNARDSEGHPLLPSFFSAGMPVSPVISPMSFGIPSLPFGGQESVGGDSFGGSTPFGGSSTRSGQQPELAVMANLVQMISDLESSDTPHSKPVSPSESAPPPPPVPSKWQKPQVVSDSCPALKQPIPVGSAQNVMPSMTQQLKATPERKGRPNRPLSPLSPTTLNCLPSALFSPGSLSPPLGALAEGTTLPALAEGSW